MRLCREGQLFNCNEFPPRWGRRGDRAAPCRSRRTPNDGDLVSLHEHRLAHDERRSAGGGAYSAPTTWKLWLTKTWCGQLTPIMWTLYWPLLNSTTRLTVPPG